MHTIGDFKACNDHKNILF